MDGGKNLETRSRACARLIRSAVLIWLLIIGSATASGTSPYIIRLPNGTVNWSTGEIMASGSGSPVDKHDPNATDAEAAVYSIAMLNAGQNLFDILQRVRIDSQGRMADLAARDPQLLVKAREMVYASREVENLRMLDDAGTLTVYLQFQLHGGFAQLVLPREIIHVDSITKVMPGKNAPAEAADPDAYTGLVVDARNIGTQPAMAPRILDENGRDVYGPAFASREFAVQKGMSVYETDFDAATANPRIGDAPLIAKGLRTEGLGRCDIVIANADAARIRQSSDHLLFLRECRVVIVLDAPK
jgi:hypothetical protein